MQRLALLHTNFCGYEKVQVERLETEQIGIVYLNSPADLNSLSEPMKRDLAAAIQELDNDINIKVLILLSKLPKVFCAGANIKEISNLSLESQLRADIFQNIFTVLDQVKKPLIVGVHGVAFGGGLEIALNADILVAATDATLGLPELKLGLIPGLGGTQRLTKIVGKTAAMKYILTSDGIPAQEAFQKGLVNLIVAKEQLREECINIGKRISEKSLYTLIAAKAAIKNAEELPMSQANKVERHLFNSLLNTQAAKEGVTAFVEKRKPNFRNI